MWCMGHFPLSSPAASSARNHAPPTPNHRPNQTKPEAGQLFFQNLPVVVLPHHTCHQILHPLFSLSQLPNALPPTVLIASTSIYILFLLLSHLIPGASCCAPLPLDPSSSSPSRLPSPPEQRHQPSLLLPSKTTSSFQSTTTITPGTPPGMAAVRFLLLPPPPSLVPPRDSSSLLLFPHIHSPQHPPPPSASSTS